MLLTNISLTLLAVGMILNAFIILRVCRSLGALWQQHETDLRMIRERFERNLALHEKATETQKKLLRLLEEMSGPTDTINE